MATKHIRFVHTTLDRLYIALVDLLTKRASALQSFPYGAFVLPELTSLRDKLAALPEVQKGRPYAAELATLDKVHDGFGTACFYLIEAYLAAPDTTQAQRDSLETLRDALGTLDDLTATYDAEAKAAKDRKDKLASLKPMLDFFPITANKTLFDWAQGFINAGESLGDMLSKRADVKDRVAAGRIRSDAIGVLNQARRELGRAQKKDPNLPADLDDQVFAFFDQLEAKSAEEAAEEKKAAEKKAVTRAPAPPGSPAEGSEDHKP
jgi:hypothetical protein